MPSDMKTPAAERARSRTARHTPAPLSKYPSHRRDPRPRAHWMAYGIFVGLAIFALGAPPVLMHFGIDPLRTNAQAALRAPGATYWFGTDDVGRDLFARVAFAARIDLSIGLAAVFIAAGAGVLLGTVAAMRGGWLDRAIQRTTDIGLTFPLFVVALALAAVVGNSLITVIAATALINLPIYIRLTRNELVARRDAPFVSAARLAGWRERDIAARMLLPAIAPLLFVQMATNTGWAMLNSAAIAFVGIGIHPPTPEWGVLIGDGANHIMTGQWWLTFFPGLALCATVLALNIAADSLRQCTGRTGPSAPRRP